MHVDQTMYGEARATGTPSDLLPDAGGDTRLAALGNDSRNYGDALTPSSYCAMSASGTDEQLLERFKAGLPDAMDELIRRYHAEVYGAAYRVLRNHEDAQDVVQEGFLKAWKHRDQFKGGSFAAWLHRISRNSVVELLRRRGGRRAAEAEYVAKRPRYERASDHLDWLAQEWWTWADSVLRQHADDTLLAIVHLRRQGLSYTEIGRVLGCCRQTVARAMTKAISILRTDLRAPD